MISLNNNNNSDNDDDNNNDDDDDNNDDDNNDDNKTFVYVCRNLCQIPSNSAFIASELQYLNTFSLFDIIYLEGFSVIVPDMFISEVINYTSIFTSVS